MDGYVIKVKFGLNKGITFTFLIPIMLSLLKMTISKPKNFFKKIKLKYPESASQNTNLGIKLKCVQQHYSNF